MNQDMERTLREFIIKNFIFEDDGSLTAEASFLDNGIIDSTGVLELIAFLEKTYEIKIEDHEIVPDNLDSVRNIALFIERRLGTASDVRCSAAN